MNSALGVVSVAIRILLHRDLSASSLARSSLRRFDRFVEKHAGPLVFIGIDPGTRVLGYGWIEVDGRNSEDVVSRGCGVIKTSANDGAALRLATILEQLEVVFQKRMRGDTKAIVVVERVFLGKNVASAFVLGQARGVVMAVAAKIGATVVEEATRTVKKTVTGNGAAEKTDVQTMLGRLLDLSDELTQLPLDASDALALAYHGWRVHISEGAMRSRERGMDL